MTLLSTIIITYSLLHQVFSNILVQVSYGVMFGKVWQKISLSDANTPEFFQILLKIERAVISMSKLFIS